MLRVEGRPGEERLCIELRGVYVREEKVEVIVEGTM
jgi:hypothetical protein